MRSLDQLVAGLGAAAVGYKFIFEPWWQSWGWYGVFAILRRQPLGIRDRVAGEERSRHPGTRAMDGV